MSNWLMSDPEVEELEIGGQDDLAADVDDGAGESDEEALDTDDEIEGLSIEEESDSEYRPSNPEPS
jgi:ATP-dependent RNA helicase DHX37/DHR1